MRRTFFLIVPIVIVTYSVQGLADEAGRVPCSEASIDALHGADHAAVVKFVNATRPPTSEELPSPNVVGEFGWANVGGGKADFVVLLDLSERGFFNRLWIYRCGAAGELKIQEIEGWEMGNLKKMFRDLNGDGKDELIIPTELDQPPGSWTPTAHLPTWPAVYTVENGRYVESSSDFPSFYDDEVLPALDGEIRKAPNEDASAIAALEKDKILRVLGRDPVAGLQQAYQWMNSKDPEVLQCAIATFADIGGHEKELLAAQLALPAAEKDEMESRKGS